MADENTSESRSKPVGLFWESEVVKGPGGEITVKAIQPVSHMSRKQAAAALGVGIWTVSDLFKLGYLTGYKPGARTLVRSDGKASNAALRLDADSVLRYKQMQVKAAKEWQDAQ